MVEGNIGVARVWNPAKQLSLEITLPNIKEHSKQMLLARGGLPSDTEAPKTPNDRISQRYKGLQLVIPAQQAILGDSEATVQQNCLNNWSKKYKTTEEREKNKFEDEENDYNGLQDIMEFLEECEQDIAKAKHTRLDKDAFVINQIGNDGVEVKILSKKFFEMLKLLRISYRELYGVLIRHGIVTDIAPADEEADQKELEDEFTKRVTEA